MRMILATGLAAALLAASGNAATADYAFNFGKVEMRPAGQVQSSAPAGYTNTFSCIPASCAAGGQQRARRTTPKLMESAVNGNAP